MQGDQQPTPPIDPNSKTTVDLFNYLDQPQWLEQASWHNLRLQYQAKQIQPKQARAIQPRQAIATTSKVSSISDRIAMAEAANCTNCNPAAPENVDLVSDAISRQGDSLDLSQPANSANSINWAEVERKKRSPHSGSLALGDRAFANSNRDRNLGDPAAPSAGEQPNQPISHVSYTTSVEAVINQITDWLDHCSEAEAKAFWLAIGQLQDQGRVDRLITQVSSVVTNYYPDRLNTADSQVSRIFWQAARQKLTMPDRPE
ncbi:hypothetical protein Pse7367_1101 [Thalassoporum mexicanum PCC 7367]|nr:hypothetical protein Pse7367_1101 [Pseudanabaena sp. PCC 7367]